MCIRITRTSLWMQLLGLVIAQIASAQEELRTLDLGADYSVNAVAFSPDGETIAIGALPTFEGGAENHDLGKPGPLQLWKWRGDEPPSSIQDHAGGVMCLAFSADGKTLATGSSDQTVRLRDPASRLTRRTLEGHRGVVFCVAFSPDGRSLVSGAGSDRGGQRQGELKVWDVAAGKELATLSTGSVNAIAVSPDGQTLAAAQGEGRVFSVDLWDYPTLRNRRTLDTFRFASTCVAFTPDGSSVATGVFWMDDAVPANKIRPGKDAGGELRLWNVATGKQQLALRGSLLGLNTMAFFPRGNVLATACYGDGRLLNIKLWDVTLGKELASFGSTEEWQWMNSLAVSPDGKTLALRAGHPQQRGSPGIVRLWNIEGVAAR